MDSENEYETRGKRSTLMLRAQAETLVQRVTRSTEAITTYLRTDEFRWQALVTTGRFTSHTMVIVVGVVAVLLATLRMGSWLDRPQVSSAAVRQTANSSTPLGGTSPQALRSNIAQTTAGKLLTGPNSSANANGSSLTGKVPPPTGQTLPIPQNQPPIASQIAYVPTPQDNGTLMRQHVLETAKPIETRQTIINYTVRAGDTIEAIAQRFGLLPTTLIWSNQAVEDSPDVLKIGQELNILPINGIYYTIEDGDSLAEIAEKFKVKAEGIVASPLNTLAENPNLIIGSKLVIPNGVKPFKARTVEASSSGTKSSAYTTYSAPAPAYIPASGNFMWPTAATYVSQGFHWGHRALDIAASVGVPVYASDSGCVSYAGWSNVGYGYMVMLNHGNGFQSLYGHLSQYYVDPGQCVNRGQVIGAMGSTGNSTGPHLHFEIRVNGVPDNPYYYVN